jgi:hypothetical protein
LSTELISVLIKHYLFLFKGIDTDKPLLQLDQYTFTGEYEDTLGTCLLFEEKEKSGMLLLALIY